jgi:hypothetical protein
VSGHAVVVARGPYYGVLGSAIGTPGFAADGAWVAYLETAGGLDGGRVPGALVAGR